MRLSENHGQPNSVDSALFQAEVEEAVDYLVSRNHGPVVDFYTDSGPYPWEKGEWKSKTGPGARNFIVAHGDHGGVGIPAATLAAELKKRGLDSDCKVKFIACNIANALKKTEMSYAQAVKMELQKLGVEVEVTAADRYVTFSRHGKLVHDSPNGAYDEELEGLTEKEYEAETNFCRNSAVLVVKALTAKYDLSSDLLYEKPEVEPFRKMLKSKQLKATEFYPKEGERTIEQANTKFLAVIKNQVGAPGRSPGVVKAVVAFFDTPAGQLTKSDFSALRQEMYENSRGFWEYRVKKKMVGWKKIRPEVFIEDTEHPNRAKRTDPSFTWSRF